MSGGLPFPVPTKQTILSIQDLKDAADQKLPRSAKDFLNSGSLEQRTLRANTDALNRYFLRGRVLTDARDIDTSTICLGRKVKFPVCCAPAGIQSVAHKDGEVATSKAAAMMGVNQAISSFASFPIHQIIQAGRDTVEEVARNGQKIETPSYAMQLYPMQNRILQERIVRQAEENGCKAIFLTGDSPVAGLKYNEHRNDFWQTDKLYFPILEVNNAVDFLDDGASWATEMKWLRQRTKMKIYVKGIMCAEDVRLAAEHGVDGVIVSNHGGRQLDGAPATIDVLEECVQAARGTPIEIFVDGGFRRGSDIFVALALGAKCVCIGRPVFWGLAYDGQKGVERMLEILYEDFKRCMAFCGCKTLADINRSCLARMGSEGIPIPLTRQSRL